jgi:hypothetical protein
MSTLGTVLTQSRPSLFLSHTKQKGFTLQSPMSTSLPKSWVSPWNALPLQSPFFRMTPSHPASLCALPKRQTFSSPPLSGSPLPNVLPQYSRKTFTSLQWISSSGIYFVYLPPPLITCRFSI